MAKNRKAIAGPAFDSDPQCISDAHRAVTPALIINALPAPARERLCAAMVAKGATQENASQATAKIETAVADWLFSGGHRGLRAKPDAEVKAELQRLADAASNLQALLSELSVGASVRLNVSLQSEGRGPWSHLQARNWNADPIEVDWPAGLLSDAPSEKIILPPNLVAKFARFQMDLTPLVEPMRRAAQFPAKKRADEQRRHLFRQTIRAWTDAVGECPTAGRADAADDPDGYRATSPIPGALREMTAAVLGAAPAALNDRAFLRVLKAERDSASQPQGLLGLARGPSAPTPKRGRPRKK